VSVVIVEDPESDGWKETGKVKEKGRRQNLLRRLFAHDAINVVGNVMGKTSVKIFANALPKLAKIPVILCLNGTLVNH
jgi:hypothetical protein